jgi:predicted GNAT family acetyltransferase
METIQFEDQGSKGRYFIRIKDQTAAELTISIADSKLWIIDHTSVNDDYRNKGFGERLVEKTVLDAIAVGAKILPLCPFARSLFDKRPDWNSIRR